MTRIVAVLTCAALGASLAFAAAATARIVPQRSLAGVRVNDTQARVRAVLGPPTRVVNTRNKFGPYREFRYPGLRVGFQGNRNVTAVDLTSNTDRTATGVGIGSSEAAVRAGVPGVRCLSSPPLRLCSVGGTGAGARVTTFFLRSNRVFRVNYGIVID